MKLYKIKYRESDGSINTALEVGNSKDDAISKFSQFSFLCCGFQIYKTEEVNEIHGHKIIVQ